jgi:hypothetical protein
MQLSSSVGGETTVYRPVGIKVSLTWLQGYGDTSLHSLDDVIP